MNAMIVAGDESISGKMVIDVELVRIECGADCTFIIHKNKFGGIDIYQVETLSTPMIIYPIAANRVRIDSKER